MFYARIHEHELISGLDRIEREIFVFQCLAVKSDETSLLSEYRSELVHNAAVYTAIVMFCSLTDLRQIKLIYHVVEQIVDSIGKCTFQCS